MYRPLESFCMCVLRVSVFLSVLLKISKRLYTYDRAWLVCEVFDRQLFVGGCVSGLSTPPSGEMDVGESSSGPVLKEDVRGSPPGEHGVQGKGFGRHRLWGRG